MMGIPHDHGDVLPPPKFLNGVNIHTGLNEPCGKGVPQIMEPEMSNLCLFHGGVKTPSEVPSINPSTVAVKKDMLGG